MAFPPCNTIIQNFSQKSNRVQNFLYSSIGLWKRFLRLTGPVAGGFLSLTAALRLRVVVSPMEPLRGRVQRVQKVHRVQRGRYRLTAMSMYAAIGSENHTTSLRSRKCTPFGAAHHFPRRGKFALCPAFKLISISMQSAAKTSPSGVAKELESHQRTGFVGERQRPENSVSR